MRLIFSLLALSLIAATAQAGVVVRISAKNLASGPSSDHQVYYAQDGMLRVDTLDDRGHVAKMSIVRDGVIWEVNVQKRTFSKMDKAAMQAKMNRVNDQLQAMLAKLPPDKRAMMEQHLSQSQQSGANFTWNDTGKSEQSGQYNCRIWGDKVTTQYCVVTPGSLPGGEELAASMRKAYATAQDLFSGIPRMAALADHFAQISKMNGFPVLTRHIEGGNAYREEFVNGVERQALPADQFAIPKGFTEAKGEGEE